MIDTILEASILVVVFLEYLESRKVRIMMENESKKCKSACSKNYNDPMGGRMGF
jgi:hypothetical protein